MAESVIKGRIELKTPAEVHSGDELTLDLLVHNVGAGHNVPTGVAELRQMWIDLCIRDQRDKIVFQRGCLDEDGEITSDAIRFGTIAGDSSGNETYKLWTMTQFLWKRTVPPGKFTRDTVTARLPADLSGTIRLEAKLLYRSASPRLVKEIMGEGAFVIDRAGVIRYARRAKTFADRPGPDEVLDVLKRL